MEYETTAEDLDIVLTLDYRLASQIEENGQETWFVEWWSVTHVDGEKVEGTEWTDLMQPEAEDIENAILEWEA